MDEEIERLIVSVRADTQIFARDVAAMRAELDGPFAAGAAQAGRALESALVRALRTGKLGFEDLKRVALSVMAEIAAASIQSGIGALFGGSKGGGGGSGIANTIASTIATLVAAFAGAPGKAIGGPVSPGRAYLVGERGPELFVPTASGRIDAGRVGSARDVRISITVNAPAGVEAGALKASSRQVARAVKQALMRVED
jgi:phage-related minor tail protein